MNSKLKNAIIFIVIASVFTYVYFTFIKKDEVGPSLAVTGANTTTASPSVGNTASGALSHSDANNQLSKDFLEVLLSIKDITLDDTIFTDVAFTNLKDSTIVLTPDGSEGRPNPFAPIGSETVIAPPSSFYDLGNDTNLDDELQVNPTDTNSETKPKSTNTTTPKKTKTKKSQ